jgi:hypothetical protein
MASILEAVGDLIRDATPTSLGTYISNGVGTLVLGILPDTPDSICAVFENTGMSPMFTMGDGGIVVDRPMVMIQVRGVPDAYEAPRDRAMAIRTYLSSLTGVTSSGINVMRIEAMGSVNHFAVDAKRRNVFSVNFLCHLQP